MPITLGMLAASGGTVTISPLTSSVQSTIGTTYTFSGLTIGAASSDRYVAVAVVGRDRSNTTSYLITSVTIGGVSASRVVGVANNGGGSGNYSHAEIWIAKVTSGTTADVVVTYPVEQILSAVALYRVSGNTSATASATSTSTATPSTLDLNVPKKWAGIGVSYNVDVGSATWSGLTEYVDAQIGTTDTGWTSAYGSAAPAESPRSISITWPSNQDTVSCCAVWGR